MNKSIASVLEQLSLIKRLQWVPLGYLALLVFLSLLSWVPPFLALMVAVLLPVYMLVFVVVLFSLGLFIFTSVVLAKVSKLEPSLARVLNRVQVVGFVVGSYLLSYFFIWGETAQDWARTQEHYLVVALDSSPVVLGLLLLAAHLYVVRKVIAKLKGASFETGTA